MIDTIKEALDAVTNEVTGAIRPAFLALAFAGALVAESFWPASRKMKSATNIAVGTTVSAVSTPAVVALAGWFWPTLPSLESFMGAAYFWFGLLGMQIVPVVSGYLGKLKTKE